ncbi:MAG TPA: hypothetical protein VGK19_10645 [Capsulimonadaceae bacterium]
MTSGPDAAAALESEAVADEYDLYVVHETPRGLTQIAWANVVHAIATGAGALLVDCAEPLSVLTTSSTRAAEPVAPTVTSATVHFVAHHPITRGLRDFTVNSSAAHTEPTADESVLATLQPGDVPALLVSRHARGHVARVAIGVGGGALRSNDPARRLIHRCAEWACSGNVIDF